MIAMQILQESAALEWERTYAKWKNGAICNIYSLFVYDLTNLFLTLRRLVEEILIHYFNNNIKYYAKH